MNSYPSTGMITTSPTNPLDEIPVGPQIFPFGTPTDTESRVNPYQSINYQQGLTTQIQTPEIYPSNTYQTINTPITYYNEPSIKYQTTQYLPSTNIGTVHNLGVVSTEYQTVVSYKPVSKTVFVPLIRTKYIAVPDDGTDVINPPIPTPNPEVQQPLSLPSTVPLPAPVQAPIMSILPPPVTPPPTSIITSFNTPFQQGNFVSNYPIYENDPRRFGSNLPINLNTLEALNISRGNLSNNISPLGTTSLNNINLGELNTNLNRGLNTTI